MNKNLLRPLALLAVALTATAALAGGDSHGSPSRGGHGSHGDHGNRDCSPRHRAEMEAVVDSYLQVVNQRDTSLFPLVFHDDYLLVSTAGTFVGLPATQGVMSAVYTAMPDVEYTLDEVLIDGDKATVRYTYTGTHLGDFLGIPPTGNTITCSGLEIDRIEDGKLVETQNFTNYYCLLAGMGAL